MTKPLTVLNDPAVENYVRRLLTRVVEAVTRQMGSALEAIVLVGGFGRGEGSVVDVGGRRFRVVNDFDLELIYRERLGRYLSKIWVHVAHRRALLRLAERLAREFDMKQVDLSLRGASTLQVAIPRLADYDMRHGHHVLWGASDPCERMWAFASHEIPIFEGTWLLRNRGMGILLARLYLDRGQLHIEDRENFYIEVNKAILAMGDALWIGAGRYTVRYTDRQAGFGSLRNQGFVDFDELARLYGCAAEYKLRPMHEPFAEHSPESLWSLVTKLYLRFFLWFESRRIGQNFCHLPDYARWVHSQPHIGRRRFVRHWVDQWLGSAGDCPRSLRPLKHDKLLSVMFVMALLGERIGADGAAEVLVRWRDRPATWQALARGFLALMHPAGEVGRFLAADGAGPS